MVRGFCHPAAIRAGAPIDGTSAHTFWRRQLRCAQTGCCIGHMRFCCRRQLGPPPKVFWAWLSLRPGLWGANYRRERLPFVALGRVSTATDAAAAPIRVPFYLPQPERSVWAHSSLAFPLLHTSHIDCSTGTSARRPSRCVGEIPPSARVAGMASRTGSTEAMITLTNGAGTAESSNASQNSQPISDGTDGDDTRAAWNATTTPKLADAGNGHAPLSLTC